MSQGGDRGVEITSSFLLTQTDTNLFYKSVDIYRLLSYSPNISRPSLDPARIRARDATSPSKSKPMWKFPFSVATLKLSRSDPQRSSGATHRLLGGVVRAVV